MSKPHLDQRHANRLSRLGDDRGQTTAEYALVLIAAASIAMLALAWAGDSGAIGAFFDAVFERITQMLP